MPIVTPALAAIIFAAGALAGTLGSLLGIGGGVFLVPFLNLVLGLPFPVSAERAGKQLINLRLGMLLEVATAAGSLLGGITAQLVAPTLLQKLFGAVSIVVALIMVGRLNR